MNRTDAPVKQSTPFAVNGKRESILPTTPAGDNTASYSDGFPAITMILKSAGGLPPKGQDMNQILYELSALARWGSSGAINAWDAAFSTAIGGYPMGAQVLGTDGTTRYISTTDSNATNPNTGGAGWFNLTTGYLKTASNLSEIAAAGPASVAAALANLRIVDATTSQKGLVRLNSGVTNESNEEAATPGAVKIAYDAAMNAFNLAKTKYTADGATTAIAGLVQLVNSMGVSNALVMPQAAVTTAIQTYPSLGKGQTLQDLRGSRGVGVTYTNSSGFPIAVYVRITGSTSANLYAYVDGKEYGGGGSTALQTAIATAFFIVPNNTSYRVDTAGVSTVLQAWTELR